MTVHDTKVFVGVDGGRNVGIAAYKRPAKSLRQGTLIEVASYPFWEAIGRLDHYAKGVMAMDYKLVFVIEDPEQISGIYSRHDADARTRAAAMKIAQDVGRVKESTQLLIDFCRMTGEEVKLVAPSARKVDHKYLARVTGWEKRSNQHGRDAAMLVFGL